MNINDLHHRALYGRPMKRNYSLNFSMFDYVLEKKLKLGSFNQVSSMVVGENVGAAVGVSFELGDHRWCSIGMTVEW